MNIKFNRKPSIHPSEDGFVINVGQINVARIEISCDGRLTLLGYNNEVLVCDTDAAHFAGSVEKVTGISAEYIIEIVESHQQCTYVHCDGSTTLLYPKEGNVWRVVHDEYEGLSVYGTKENAVALVAAMYVFKHRFYEAWLSGMDIGGKKVFDAKEIAPFIRVIEVHNCSNIPAAIEGAKAKMSERAGFLAGLFNECFGVNLCLSDAFWMAGTIKGLEFITIAQGRHKIHIIDDFFHSKPAGLTTQWVCEKFPYIHERAFSIDFPGVDVQYLVLDECEESVRRAFQYIEADYVFAYKNFIAIYKSSSQKMLLIEK